MRIIPLLGALALTAAVPGLAQTSGFVVRIGADTTAVERVVRLRSGFNGTLVERIPRVRLWTWTATLAADGSVERFESSSSIPSLPNRPADRVEMVFGRDSARITISSGDSTRTLAGPITRPVAPWVGSSYQLFELAVRQAVALGRDSVPVQLFSTALRQWRPGQNYVKRVGRDSALLDYFGSPMRARVDAEGSILGLSGRNTTNKVLVERVDDVDAETIGRRFAAAEAAGRPAGPLSPRDTVRAVVGSAELWVDYGRPQRRGRTIFGEVVPWNQVWRTGANAATQLHTGVALWVGEQVIPPGTYTLWSISTPEGTTLIVNKQTGQWGTVYDPAQDLIRLPLRVERLPAPVEQFTIAIVSGENGGELRFEWEQARWVLPFTAR